MSKTGFVDVCNEANCLSVPQNWQNGKNYDAFLKDVFKVLEPGLDTPDKIDAFTGLLVYNNQVLGGEGYNQSVTNITNLLEEKKKGLTSKGVWLEDVDKTRKVS